jgi:hypothetical protein
VNSACDEIGGDDGELGALLQALPGRRDRRAPQIGTRPQRRPFNPGGEAQAPRMPACTAGTASDPVQASAYAGQHAGGARFGDRIWNSHDVQHARYLEDSIYDLVADHRHRRNRRRRQVWKSLTAPSRADRESPPEVPPTVAREQLPAGASAH